MLQDINKPRILDSEKMVMSLLFTVVCAIVFIILVGALVYDHIPAFLRNFIFPP